MVDCGINFSINTVYSIFNKPEVLAICGYCLEKGFHLRVIEQDFYCKITDEDVSPAFGELMNSVIDQFDLSLEVLSDGKGFVAYHSSGTSIRFYDSYCHNMDCDSCANWTLRINASGNALPCYIRDFQISLLDGTDLRKNFATAINQLGIPPVPIPTLG